MRNRIRMIAADLDGTLLNSQKRIADEDREALRAAAARGVEIVPVTGRNYSTALPIVAELLTTGPLIASNGAIIRSKDGETHLRGLLPIAIAREVLRATLEYRHYTVVTFDQNGEGQFRIEVPADEAIRGNTAFTGGEEATRRVLTAKDSPLLPPDGVAASPWIKRYRDAVRFTDSLERDLDSEPVEIMFAGPVALMREVAELLRTGLKERANHVQVPGRFAPQHDRARQVQAEEAGEARGAEETSGGGERFRLLRTEYPERNFAILDVVRHDCSKGSAIEFWSRFRGIAREEIMAIGDNYNDLEMLRYAGLPVVMGNAEEALKQQGWPMTLDCDSGGVARAVERFVLSER